MVTSISRFIEGPFRERSRAPSAPAREGAASGTRRRRARRPAERGGRRFTRLRERRSVAHLPAEHLLGDRGAFDRPGESADRDPYVGAVSGTVDRYPRREHTGTPHEILDRLHAREAATSSDDHLGAERGRGRGDVAVVRREGDAADERTAVSD